MGADAGAHGVEDGVEGGAQEVVRPVDPARPEPVAEQAAAAVVATVVCEGIAAEEELHAAPRFGSGVQRTRCACVVMTQ